MAESDEAEPSKTGERHRPGRRLRHGGVYGHVSIEEKARLNCVPIGEENLNRVDPGSEIRDRRRRSFEGMNAAVVHDEVSIEEDPRIVVGAQVKGHAAADRRIEIRIDYLSGGVASVQCFCHRYVDLLHLIDMPDGWKIVNAAWRLR